MSGEKSKPSASQVTWGSTLVPIYRNNQCECLFKHIFSHFPIKEKCVKFPINSDKNA